MILRYKLDGRKVSKEEFLNSTSSGELLKKWETVVNQYADELRKGKMCVIMHWYNGELKVVTETRMLMKLYCEVYKNMFFHTGKKDLRTDIPSFG